MNDNNMNTSGFNSQNYRRPYSYKKKVSKNYKGKHPGKSRRKLSNPVCPNCGKPIKMIPYDEMDFRFKLPEGDLRRPEFYWVCSDYPNCNTYVKADNSTKKPMGTLAGPKLRHMRMAIHHWENMLVSIQYCSRQAFREKLGFIIGEPVTAKVHVNSMTELQCKSILDDMIRLYETDKRVHKAVENSPNSTPWKEVRGLNQGANHGVLYDEDGDTYDKDDDAESEAMRASAEIHLRQLGERFF